MLLAFEGFELMGATTDASSVVRPRMDLRYPGGTLTNGNGVDLVDNDQANGIALRWGTTASSEFNQWHIPVGDQSGNTLVIGMRMKLNSNSTSDSNFVTIRGSVSGTLTDQIALQVENNQNLRLMRGFTEVANVPSVFTPGAWHYVEFEISVDNSTGHAKVWINGTLQMDVSSQDTQNGTTDIIEQVEFNGVESVDGTDYAAIDDIYILNTAGASPTARLGIGTRIFGRLPDADGSTTDFDPSTPGDHYVLVDEDPEGTSDYTEGDTGTELFSYAASPSTPDIFHAVEIEIIGRADAAGVSTFRGRVESGASSDTGPTEAMVSTDEDIVARALFTEDPDTAAAWTEAGINGAEFGVEIV